MLIYLIVICMLVLVESFAEDFLKEKYSTKNIFSFERTFFPDFLAPCVKHKDYLWQLSIP